jgi:hypothetical protein
VAYHSCKAAVDDQCVRQHSRRLAAIVMVTGPLNTAPDSVTWPAHTNGPRPADRLKAVDVNRTFPLKSADRKSA